jgi:hypothetical protein
MLINSLSRSLGQSPFPSLDERFGDHFQLALGFPSGCRLGHVLGRRDECHGLVSEWTGRKLAMQLRMVSACV